MTGPSEHLSWKELSCKDRMRTTYPIDFRDDPTRLPRLAAAFEAVRALWSQPITILSAYRTPIYNASVGGARYSQHVQGRALDMAPPEGVALRAFHNAIVDLATQNPGLGIRFIQGYGRKGFVHMDVRPGAKLIEKWEA